MERWTLLPATRSSLRLFSSPTLLPTIPPALRKHPLPLPLLLPLPPPPRVALAAKLLLPQEALALALALAVKLLLLPPLLHRQVLVLQWCLQRKACSTLRSRWAMPPKCPPP